MPSIHVQFAQMPGLFQPFIKPGKTEFQRQCPLSQFQEQDMLMEAASLYSHLNA